MRSYDVSEEALLNPPADGHAGTLVYEGQRGQAVNTGVLAADGRTLVIAATDAVVFLDTHGQRPLRTWGKSAHVVNLSADGQWITTMLHNHLPVIWRTADGRAVFWGEPRNRIEFSPDCRHSSVATEAEVRILSLDSMRPAFDPIRLEIPGAAPPVAWSPDGRMFAVALNRTHPRLFEAATGRELATLSPAFPGVISEAKTLSFSPDGQWLVAAKNDGETVAWNLPVVRNELGQIALDWTFTAGTGPQPVTSANAGNALDLSGLFARPARDPATPLELINLDRHYNATLTEHWHPGGGCSDLSELPPGVQTLAGVRFDIRGLIQCGSFARSGQPYPRQVTNIVVGFPARRLHFLHGAIMASGLPADFQIGRYVIRYADGQTQEIPLRVGREFADWWTQDAEDISRMEVAWTGQNAASRGARRTVRLFKTTWENPRPPATIQSLDVQATHFQACPFLVAVTAE